MTPTPTPDPTPAENAPLTVLLIPKARAALASSSAREQLSQTDVVNRALQLYEFYLDHRPMFVYDSTNTLRELRVDE